MVGHVLDCVLALAALVAILDYFGIKPKRPLWGILMPLTRNWKLAIMLILVAASLGMSAYGFYISFRPKVVEKTVTVTVEKPVDRIVEKEVPAKCPNSCPSPLFRQKPKPVVKPTETKIEQYGEASGAVGGSINQGPCSVAQLGGSNNQGTSNCILSTPDTIKSLVIRLKMVCEVRSGHAIPADQGGKWVFTSGSGVTLEGFPRLAVLSPEGEQSRTASGDKVTVEQIFSKDENYSILGSPVSDLKSIARLSFNPMWSDGNWCSRIVSAHVSMIMNHDVLMDSEVPLTDGGIIADDKPGQAYPSSPQLKVSTRYFQKIKGLLVVAGCPTHRALCDEWDFRRGRLVECPNPFFITNARPIHHRRLIGNE
jgi:hypothetical protein